MTCVMDYDTAEHFYKWLNRCISDDEQHVVEEQVHKLLREYPDMVETHSWQEMRDRARRYHIPV